MAPHILLLRGINLGSTNRISMPDLRAALEDAGFDDVRTYLQSGNVVLSGTGDVAEKARRLIAKEFGLDISVIVRTRTQLAKVVELNPLAKVAKNPKRYQVSFLDAKPSRDTVRRIEEAAAQGERVVVHGRARDLRVAPGHDRPVPALGPARRSEPRRHCDGAELDNCSEAAGARRCSGNRLSR